MPNVSQCRLSEGTAGLIKTGWRKTQAPCKRPRSSSLLRGADSPGVGFAGHGSDGRPFGRCRPSTSVRKMQLSRRTRSPFAVLNVHPPPAVSCRRPRSSTCRPGRAGDPGEHGRRPRWTCASSATRRHGHVPRPLLLISMNSWRRPAPGSHHASAVMPDGLEPVRKAGIPPNRPNFDQFAQCESVRRQFTRFRSPGVVEFLPGRQRRVIFSLVFNSVRQKACRKQVCSDMSSISCATSSGSDVSR